MDKEFAFFGEVPKKNSWDNSYSVVKDYLLRNFKDPDSLEFKSCSDVFKLENKGWAIHCSYRGKNSFNATVLNSNWFIIRQGRIVAVEKSDTYTLK